MGYQWNGLPSFPPVDTNLNLGKPRKFLVFDQSGDQTRLLYSSANESLPPWIQKPSTGYNSMKKNLPPGCDELVEENTEESEMREDTEELNALLYSDEDDCDYYSDDEDETSTGHSPNTINKEVASSEEPTKRRKLLDGSCNAEHNTVFGSSGLEEDDAESSCGNSRRKRSIRETITILQKIIPGGKGKDAMDVIDGTIRYLKSLKVQAKSLRLDSL